MYFLYKAVVPTTATKITLKNIACNKPCLLPDSSSYYFYWCTTGFESTTEGLEGGVTTTRPPVQTI